MRQQMIEALSYPRSLVQQIVDGRGCPHDSLFEATSERCRQCDINRECHWVACLNEFGDFEEKPTYTINASLRYGVKLVESLHKELHHDDTLRTREAHSWVCHARRLIDEFEQNLAPNRYRPTH